MRNATYLDGVQHVPDEMARAFVAIGDLDKVRTRVGPIWQLADSVCFCPPSYAMTPEKMMYYQGQIAALMG